MHDILSHLGNIGEEEKRKDPGDYSKRTGCYSATKQNLAMSVILVTKLGLHGEEPNCSLSFSLYKGVVTPLQTQDIRDEESDTHKEEEKGCQKKKNSQFHGTAKPNPVEIRLDFITSIIFHQLRDLCFILSASLSHPRVPSLPPRVFLYPELDTRAPPPTSPGNFSTQS